MLNRPEQAGDSQLLYFSGRIYRKSLLCKQLAVQPTLSNQALMEQAIRCWGSETHRQVEGAYVAVFTVNDEYYAVRGVYDSPPLYYTLSAATLCLCADLAPLIPLLPSPVQLDAGVIRHYLAFANTRADQSPYKDLHSIAAGQGIRINAEGQVHDLRPHFPLKTVSVIQAQDAIDHWYHALQSALADAAEGHERIAILLSGGVDSGAIAVMAREMNLPVSSITMSIPNFPDEDEGEYASQLARSLNLTHQKVVVTGQCFDNILDTSVSLISPGINPYQHFINAGYRKAEEMGVSAIWLGTGGDEVYAPLRNMLRDLWRDQGWGITVRSAIQGFAYPVPHIYKSLLNGILGRRPRKLQFPSFMIESDNEEYFQYPKVVGGDVKDLYHRGSVFQFNHVNASALETEHIKSAGMARFHPYCHPAIIETALSTPVHLTHSHKFKKHIMRQMVSTMTSDAFVWRRRVGVLNQYYMTGWSRNLADIKAVLLDADRTWPQFVHESPMHSGLQQGNPTNPMLLLNCLALELWLNKLKSENLLFELS